MMPHPPGRRSSWRIGQGLKTSNRRKRKKPPAIHPQPAGAQKKGDPLPDDFVDDDRARVLLLKTRAMNPRPRRPRRKRAAKNQKIGKRRKPPAANAIIEGRFQAGERPGRERENIRPRKRWRSTRRSFSCHENSAKIIRLRGSDFNTAPAGFSTAAAGARTKTTPSTSGAWNRVRPTSSPGSSGRGPSSRTSRVRPRNALSFSAEMAAWISMSAFRRRSFSGLRDRIAEDVRRRSFLPAVGKDAQVIETGLPDEIAQAP